TSSGGPLQKSDRQSLLHACLQPQQPRVRCVLRRQLLAHGTLHEPHLEHRVRLAQPLEHLAKGCLVVLRELYLQVNAPRPSAWLLPHPDTISSRTPPVGPVLRGRCVHEPARSEDLGEHWSNYRFGGAAVPQAFDVEATGLQATPNLPENVLEPASVARGTHGGDAPPAAELFNGSEGDAQAVPRRLAVASDVLRRRTVGFRQALRGVEDGERSFGAAGRLERYRGVQELSVVRDQRSPAHDPGAALMLERRAHVPTALRAGSPESSSDRFACDLEDLDGAIQQGLRPPGGERHPLELLQRSTRAVVSHGHVATEP